MLTLLRLQDVPSDTLASLATSFPMLECLCCHFAGVDEESSDESCGHDVEDVLALELEEPVDNPGTTIGTEFSVLT